MNYAAIALAYFVGSISGMLILAFFMGTQGPRHKKFDEPENDDVLDDTDLLDYLQDAKCHLFFNKDIGDNGSWGFLGGTNDLLAVGLDPRQAIRNAQLKQAARAANEVAA